MIIEENQIKTLSKKIPTKKEGIFYKEIQHTFVDDKGKVKTSIIDKVYVIRYRDGEGKERLYTVGKYSEGIREVYCKAKRDEFVLLAKNGELPARLQKQRKKKIVTLDEIFQSYKKYKKSESKDLINVNGGVKFCSFFVKKLRKVTLSNEGLIYSFY